MIQFRYLFASTIDRSGRYLMVAYAEFLTILPGKFSVQLPIQISLQFNRPLLYLARPERLTRIASWRFSGLRSACGVQNASAFCRTGVLIIIQDTQNKKGAPKGPLLYLARPERFELPTARFVAGYSIQLSYGRIILYSRLKPLQQFVTGGERGIRTLEGV